MKNIIFYLFILLQTFSYSQVKKNGKPLSEEELKEVDTLVKPEEILFESSTLACKCIDSIPAINKSTKEKSIQIRKCIDDQVIAYQSAVKLSLIVYTEPTDSLNISINVNPESKEYKKYYYEIERDLMDNCSSLKNLIGSNDVEGKNSFSKNPDAIDAYNDGLKWLNANDYEKALPYFQKAVEIDANFAFAWDNLGIIHRNLGNYKEAIKAYKKSIDINEINRTPLQNLALVYMFQEKYKKAIRTYKKLGKINEDNPEVFYGIGNAYKNLEEYEKSLDNMCKAYNLYISQNSPYRTDAEKIINILYKKMKSDGKENRFKEILKSNNINY